MHMAFESYRFNVGGKLACRLGGVFAVLALSLPLAAQADTIVGDPVDWDANEPSTAWTALGTSAIVAENAAGANDFLQISFPGGIDPGAGLQWYETAQGPSADLFAGDWTGYSIEFDFWADSTLPDTLQIRWGADGTGRTWANDVTPSGVGSWDTLRTDTLSSVDDWRLDAFVDQDEFLADLGAIDWIGVYIFRDGTDAEIYGVDDFSLMVPEPEE
jgi:hypothetical protein